jgi:hypothetical protein
MKLPALSVALLFVSGFATLEAGADRARKFPARHPVVTAVGAAVVVGGAVALSRHHSAGESGCLGYYESRGASLTAAEHDCR